MFFFFNDTATTEIYTLSLHDALPICGLVDADGYFHHAGRSDDVIISAGWTMSAVEIEDTLLKHPDVRERSEEHTSELQSPCNLVCRLLLEKKKKTSFTFDDTTAQPRT